MTRILALAMLALACSPPVRPVAGKDCDGLPPRLDETRRLAAGGWLFQALEHAEDAHASCPGAGTLLARAEILAELGRDDDARAAYRAYAESGAAGAHERAARALAELARRPAADRAVTPADRARAGELYRLGETLRFRGELDEAVRTLRRAYAAAPHPLTIAQIGLVHRARADAVAERTSYARALAIAEATRRVRAQPRWAEGHLGAIHHLAIAPGGRLIASGGADGTVRVWTRGARRERLVLEHGGPVAEVRLSPDAALVAARTVADAVRVWDTGTGSLLLDTRAKAMGFRTDGALALGSEELGIWTEADGMRAAFRLGDAAGPVFFNSDASLVAVLTGGQLVVRRVAEGRELGRLPMTATDPDVWLPPGGVHADAVVALHTPTGAMVWSLGEGRALLEVGAISEVAFSADGRTMAVATPDSVWLIDAATGTTRSALQESQECRRLWLSGDGTAVLGVVGAQLVRWHAGTGARAGSAHDLPDHRFDGVIEADDQRRSFVHTSGPGIVVTDLASAEAVAAHGSDLLMPTTAAISASGELLVGTASDAGSDAWQLVRLTPSGAQVLSPQTGGLVLAIEPLDRADSIVEIARSGTQIVRGERVQSLSGHDPHAAQLGGEALAVLGGGKLVATAAHRDAAEVRLWQMAPNAEPRLLHTLPPLPASVVALAFVDGGNHLAIGTVGREGGLTLVDTATGTVRAQAAGPIYALAASSDRTRFAAGRPDGLLTIHDGRSAKGVSIQLPDAIWSLAWAADDVILAGLESGEVGIVSARQRRLVERVRVHRSGPVRRMSVGPGGTVATTGGDRATALLRGRGALLGHVLISAEGAWAFVSADGRVDASPGGESLLYWQIGDVQLPGFVGWQRGGSPGLLRSAVTGTR